MSSLAKKITEKDDYAKKYVFAIALNSQKFIEENKEKFEAAPYNGLPKKPVIYVLPRPTWGHDQDLVTIPQGHDSLRFEPHLGIVFGKKVPRVSQEEASAYIKSFLPAVLYSINNDNYYRPDIGGRNKEGFCILGEPVAFFPELADQYPLKIKINGEEKFLGLSDKKVFSVATLISDLSQFMSFNEGDILLTGTNSDTFLAKKGDKVEVFFDSLGIVTNQLV